MNMFSRGNKLGLGLAALGRPGYINLGHGDDLNHDYAIESMEQRAHEVLDAAFAIGIRYFDAARSYGKAEQFLRSWLDSRRRQPSEVTVGSKWGYRYTADWQVDADVHEEKEHSLDRLETQFVESSRQLGPYLNLYQIHSATLESGVLENQSVLDRLWRLKESGYRIGLSVSGAQQADVIDMALGIRSSDTLLFDTVQATWNLLEQSAGPALHRAHEAGLSTIIKETLANGRLTGRGKDEGGGLEWVCGLADRLGIGLDALAIAIVLHNKWTDMVLIGAASTDHVHSNAPALEVKLDDQTMAEFARVAETPETYWQRRSNLSWN